jgi:hypothetical protein
MDSGSGGSKSEPGSKQSLQTECNKFCRKYQFEVVDSFIFRFSKYFHGISQKEIPNPDLTWIQI